MMAGNIIVMAEMKLILPKPANHTKPSSIIFAADVAVRKMMVESMLQWWLSCKR